MTEQTPQEPKKKPKGLPTWVWFVGTFAVVSLLGNVVFGGNTWITSSMNFVSNALASWQVEEDTSGDPFCTTGEISDIDRENALSTLATAKAQIETTSGVIGYASAVENEAELSEAIELINDSGPTYRELGERLLTADACEDATFSLLMSELGDTMLIMGENFDQWSPGALYENPELLSSLPLLIEGAVEKADALISYLEKLP